MTQDKLKYLVDKPKKYLFDGCKILYHQDRLKQYLDGKRIAPIHIDMGIHKACNIRCIYCYGIKQKPSPEYIPLDRLILLVDDCVKLGIKSLAVIGDGEPTLNKGLYIFTSYARKNNLDISVATNGLLLNKEKIKTLTNNCVWLRFNISGVDKYDYIHGTKDKFKKFEDNIKLAVKYKKNCTIGLQMVLIPECFSEVIPLAKKALEWGVDYLVIKQFSNPEEGIPVNFNMDEYDKVMNDLKIAEEMSNEKTKIIIKWSALKDTRNITKHKHWDFDRCIDLPFIFQISGNGKCYPCGYLFGNTDYCYGDVTQQRLKTILTSEHYWSIVKRVANIPLADLCKGQCRHCETNKFIDRAKKLYNGFLEETLIEMCGSKEQYDTLIKNPPEHINFI